MCSTPKLASPGEGPSFRGNFTAESARDLEIQLRGGALPLPVAVVENRTVGPTLGRDSIQRSLYAALGGLILVLIFYGGLLPFTRHSGGYCPGGLRPAHLGGL